MPRRDEVDRLLEAITVDCYNLAEQVTAFYEAFVEEVTVPTTAAVVGSTVRVVGIDIAEQGDELMARCRRGAVAEDLRFSDLVFAPDTPAAWIHAAYRRCFGLTARPAAVPAGWPSSWL